MKRRFEYFITDVHGHIDQLVELLHRIGDHAEANDAVLRLIFVGDYVDRGPASREVVELIRGLCVDQGAIALMGNHERWLLDTLETLRRSWSLHPGRYGVGALKDLEVWERNGGDATLRSYGNEQLPVHERVPLEHLTWLRGLPIIYQTRHRIAVHAGFKPGFPVTLQDEETCLWAREVWLRAKHHDFPGLDKFVVHGHTPTWAGRPNAREPELIHGHRVNLDCGTFFTGVLTAAVFDADAPGEPIDYVTVEGKPSQEEIILGPQHDQSA